MSEDTLRIVVYGRIFQKISIDDKIYLAPVANDDREEDRLTSQHDLLHRLFGNALLSPRVPIVDPRKVLDCGYGGGDWSVQFAEAFEDCEVCISRWMFGTQFAAFCVLLRASADLLSLR